MKGPSVEPMHLTKFNVPARPCTPEELHEIGPIPPIHPCPIFITTTVARRLRAA